MLHSENSMKTNVYMASNLSHFSKTTINQQSETTYTKPICYYFRVINHAYMQIESLNINIFKNVLDDGALHNESCYNGYLSLNPFAYIRCYITVIFEGHTRGTFLI